MEKRKHDAENIVKVYGKSSKMLTFASLFKDNVTRSLVEHGCNQQFVFGAQYVPLGVADDDTSAWNPPLSFLQTAFSSKEDIYSHQALGYP